MTDSINYSVKSYEGSKILDLKGNLNAVTVENFTSLVRAILEKESIIINLEQVPLISSSGIEALVEVSILAKEFNQRVILLWAPEDIIRITELMEYYPYLIFADNQDEAITKLKFYT